MEEHVCSYGFGSEYDEEGGEYLTSTECWVFVIALTVGAILALVVLPPVLLYRRVVALGRWFVDPTTSRGAYLCQTGLCLFGFACFLVHLQTVHVLVIYPVLFFTYSGSFLAIYGFLMTAFGRAPNKSVVPSLVMLLGIFFSIFLLMMFKQGMIPELEHHLLGAMTFLFLIYAPWAYLYFGNPPKAGQTNDVASVPVGTTSGLAGQLSE